ncbi:hypothetical protein HY635_00020 [Candidatus Uhrbacteria bacterium]|nr:hypothetical protein [Candidatus Uhrbacteria bacterium]
MAKPAVDQSTPAQPPPDEAAAKRPPPSERGREVRLEDAEQKEVTLESLEREVEELVGQAESGKADFDATREQVLERIRSYGGDLVSDERAKLDQLKARAESRVRDLKVKALETRISSIKAKLGETADGGRYSGPQAAILASLEGELAALKKEGAPAEAVAADSEEVAALKRRIENIKRAQGESAGGEHYRGPQADILKDLETQLAVAQGKGTAAGAEPEIKFEEPVVEEGKEGAPTVAPETAPPTPEAEPARPLPSARELMSIAKIRAALHDNPEALKAAIEQAKYAESKGLLETEASRASLIELVKSASGLEQQKALRGPALERLAKEIGVEPAQLEAALDRQHAALEQRARDEVRRESQAGLKAVVAKGAAYVGLGALLNRFLPGWGAITAGVRMVETWRQGSVEEQKVQQRIAELEKQLAEGDPKDPKALASEFLRDLAADVASTKRAQIDGIRPAAGELADPRVMATAMQHDTIQFLRERYPNLSPEQQSALARGAKALYMMDHANAKLEAQVAGQQPNGFRKFIATLDKVLGSKVLRGGETTREKMLTTVVFAAAGAMARELPIIRNILFAYSGFKAGEMIATGITKRAGRYEVLKPVSAAALAGETVEQGVLDRARAQLLDAEFRTKNPAEAQQLREAVERHELALLGKAESATTFVGERTAAMEQKLVEKRTKEQERQAVVNSARIAGALAGAILGPMAVEWIAKKLHPEPTAAPPEAVAPVEPEVDPRMEMVGTRQAGDGWTHIRARQFYAMEHPELSGDQIVAKMEAHKQMLQELRASHGYKFAANPKHWDDRAFSLKYIELGKADAMANGVLAPDGRTTLVSLRGEGVLPFDETGTHQLAPKGHLEFYATKAKFGYGPIGPVAGTEITTGDVRYLDAGDTAMSEEDYAAWLKEHPDTMLARVHPGGRAGEWQKVTVLEREGKGHVEWVRRDDAVGAGVEAPRGSYGGRLDKFLDALHAKGAPGERASQLAGHIQPGERLHIPIADGKEILLENRDGRLYWSTDEGSHFTDTYDDRTLGQIEQGLTGAVPAEAPAVTAVPEAAGRSGAGVAQPDADVAAALRAGGSPRERADALDRILESRAATSPLVGEALVPRVESTWKGLLTARDVGTSDFSFDLGGTGEKIHVLDVRALENLSMRDLLTDGDIPKGLKGVAKAVAERLAAAHQDWVSKPGVVNTAEIAKGLGAAADRTVLDYLTTHPELVKKS